MITSFAVGAIFKIEDQATPVVARLATEMQKLATLTATVRTELQSISSVRIGSVTNRVTALAAALDKGATAASAMAAGVATGVAAMDAGLSTALATARALTAQLAAAGRAGAGMRMGGGAGGPPALPPPLPGAGGHGRRPHGPFHFGRIGAHAGPMHASVGGSGPAIATGVGAWSVAHVMKEAMDPLHQEAMLSLLGLDQGQIKQVTEQARATSSAVPGSGFSENVKTIGEMYSIVGLPHALELSKDFAQLDRVMGSVGKGKDEGSGFILSRAGEMMGKLSNPEDVSAFRHTLETMARVGVATHGKVTPAEWLNFVKQAGPAAGTLTDEGLYTSAAIIQTMGGYRAGTAAQAISRQFAGGVMTKSKADELKRLGIFQEGDYTVERGGHVQFRTDAAKGFVDRLQHDPLTAITDVLEPALEKHGLTSLEDQTREIYKIIGTGPAQRETYELLRGHKQIVAERERAKQALAPGAAMPFMQEHDPTQAMAGFTKSFNDMLGALGSRTLQASIPLTNGLTGMFNGIAAWAASHQKTAGVLGGIATGAAGGAAVGLGIGWLGGPVGIGGGTLIGGGVGGGIAAWNSLPPSVKSGMAGGWNTGSALTPMLPGLGGVIGAGIGGAWGALPAALTPASAATQPTQGGGTTVKADITVKAETDRPAGLAELVLNEINKLISQGHLHNQGEADSTASSPYVTGLGL